MTPEDVFRLRRELAAIRGRVEELCRAIQEHSEAIQARNKNRAVQERMPVLVSYDQNIDAAQNRQYGTQEKIAKWTKRAVIAASIYAGIAALQWCEMRKATIATTNAANAAAQQTALTRQQLEGTMAAVVTINPTIEFFDSTKAGFDGEINITFINTGHVNARQIQGKITWQKVSVPSGKPLEQSHTFTVEPFDLSYESDRNQKSGFSYRFPLSEPEHKQMLLAKLTVSVTTDATYLDGFELSPRPLKDCSMKLFLRMDETSNGLIENRVVSCQDLPTWYKVIEKEEATYIERHRQQKTN